MKHPRVLLIMVDALRFDRLHCCGNSWPTSPVMDRLAGEGVLFRQMIAHSSHTLPCVGSILTGLDPLSHGLIDPRTHIGHTWGAWETPLNALERNGYAIGAFDAYMYFHFGRHAHIENDRQAAAFFEAHRDVPFFVWQFFEDVHLPYDPPPPYDTAFLPKDFRISPEAVERLKAVRSTMILHRPGLVSQFELDQAAGRGNAFEADADRQIDYRRSAAGVEFPPEDRIPITALYDGEVRAVDDRIAAYLRPLEELGILDDTLVVVTSDHGEELLERGSVGHSSCSLAGTLYEEAVHVPFIIRYPRALPRGRIVEKQASQSDIMPTLFDILGLKSPEGVEGRSLLPLIHGADTSAAEETFGETLPCGWQTLKDDRRRIWSIRTPRWKYIHNQFEPQARDRDELYDLTKDPAEKENVLRQNPQIAADLDRKLRAWMRKEVMGPLKPSPSR